jgi:putative phosphoribosyl transferase
VAPPGWTARIGADADEMVCLETPDPFFAIGQFYADFSQTSDAEVVACLERAARRAPAMAASPSVSAGDDPAARDEEVEVRAGPVRLGGHLTLPEQAVGVVVFAHGSGSSRHSPRNRQVAATLNEHGLATLLLDLLTTDEELDRAKVFDIPLLAARLVAATRWAQTDSQTAGLPIGYFGASTGAGAALWAAAELGDDIRAVVSRGGRPDLAALRLADVRAPVLLIVGGRDEVVIELNRQAQSGMRTRCGLSIVPGATHLFEEPGALEEVSRLASTWLQRHLLAAPTPTA